MQKKLRYLSLMAAIVLAALAVSPAIAAPPEPIHIVVEEFPGGVGAPPEPFTASGPAVVNGSVCATGLVADVEVSYNDTGGPYGTIWALKRFDCGDGSGTFDVKMIVRWDLTTLDTTARWRVVGGTGDYAGLRGHGSLVGTSNNPDPGIWDVYDGLIY